MHIAQRTQPRAVDFREEVEDLVARSLGAAGWTNDAIVKFLKKAGRRGLTKGQVQYRLDKNRPRGRNSERWLYRHGIGPVAELVAKQASTAGSPLLRTVSRELELQGLFGAKARPAMRIAS